MTKTTHMLAVASLVAITAAILPSCGDKKEQATTDTKVEAKAAPEAIAKVETVNLELTGLM